jgi:hypothetical protein
MRCPKRFESTAGKLLYLLLTTPLAIMLGICAGKFLLPVIQAIAIFPLYFCLLSRAAWRQTASVMIIWALLVAIWVGLTSHYQPTLMESSILNAGAYRDEMFHWISTGVGPEGSIRLFLPQHALHFLVFSLLTLLSAGFLGLVMGSVLMNYMAYYVGVLLLEAESVNNVLLLAWPPWAMIRVGGFIVFAMALSMLTFRRFCPSVMERRKIRNYALLGLGMLVVDVILKWALAGIWQDSLKRFTGL